MKLRFATATVALAWTLLAAYETTADPIPGRDILKFSQLPMLNTTLVGQDGNTEVFHGHDELSTAYRYVNPTDNSLGYRGQFMADDFADRFDSPVVHVKWWGSYLHRPSILPENEGVRRFLISFESDIPRDPNNPNSFSRPGEPLRNQIVTVDADGVLTPGEGTFTEREVAPISVDGPIYEYNAELHLDKPFPQKPDTVYWLKIVALVDPIDNLPLEEQLAWGWHNRDYTIPDPLASVLPAVDPGEHIQGFLPAAGGDIPIWHFQDDSVNGFVDVMINPNDPMSQIMPNVIQDVGGPQHYLPPFDGPSLIGQFSKDLAFQLFTVPEPGTMLLALIGLSAIGFGKHRAR